MLLGLHGAMVAHGYDDTEGDVIERVRAIVGPDCVIGVELDPHCHLTLKRVRLADIIILYKEFPHTDVVERAEDLLTLVLRTIRKQIKPVMSLYDCRQIGQLSHHAAADARLRRQDRGDGGQGRRAVGLHRPLLPLCRRAGTRPAASWSITDNDKAKADRLATAIGQEFISMRGRTAPDYLSIEDGIDRRARRSTPAPS